MRIFKITVLVIVLAMLGSTFTIDAKVKKRRSTTKKEKTFKNKKTNKSVKAKNEQCILDMVEYGRFGMRSRSNDVEQVRIERKNGKVVIITGGREADEREYIIDDGEQILKQALEIIEQENMLGYAANYYPDPNEIIHDGWSWTFKAQLADGRSVSSKGRNAGPDGLDGEGLIKMRKLLFDRVDKLLEK